MEYRLIGCATAFFIMGGLKPILKPLLDFPGVIMLTAGLCLMFITIGAIADGVNKK